MNDWIKDEPDWIRLQRLLFPDDDINSEPLLFFRGQGNAYFDSLSSCYVAEPGAGLAFSTYFNALSLDSFDLPSGTRIRISVSGRGRGMVSVKIAQSGMMDARLLSTALDLDKERQTLLDVEITKTTGLLFLEFEAMSELSITGLDYDVMATPMRKVSVAAVITTFKRNDAVQATARRLARYFDDNPDLRDVLDLVVVDNGGDTDAVPFEGARVLKNPNYGGAGGFARGLFETVMSKTATHCLFMDDDASFFPEALRRTIAALLLSRDDKLAVAGAMITSNKQWRLWENAAVFRRRCQPINGGFDLGDKDDILYLAQVPQPRVSNKYGGWWYFCFPVAEVQSWPFPFFVRGDDVSFSLANPFTVKTLLGVASHQDDFFAKQTPLTVYLDMRSHFVHQLTIKELNQSLWSDVKMFFSYFYRFNAGYHYESARSVILAIQDISRGRDFWVENMDMSEKRREIAGYTVFEKPSANFHYDPSTVFVQRPSLSAAAMQIIRQTVKEDLGLDGDEGETGEAQNVSVDEAARRSAIRDYERQLQKADRFGPAMALVRDLSLNGHLLPRFLLHKKGRALGLANRGNLSITFLRPFVLRFDPNTQQGYRVQRDVGKFFANMLLMTKVVARYALNYSRIKAAYAQTYRELTSEEFWTSQFRGIGGDDGDTSTGAQPPLASAGAANAIE